MEVSLPQTMLQKLLDLLKLESFRPHQEIAIQSIIQDQKDVVICTHIDYHNQHESAVLIGLFHATASVLTSVESYQNYRKPTQRGVQGYLSSLQRRVSHWLKKKNFNLTMTLAFIKQCPMFQVDETIMFLDGQLDRKTDTKTSVLYSYG